MKSSLKTAKLALLPSLLVASLAMSACQNSSSPSDTDAENAAVDSTGDVATNDSSAAVTTDTAVDESVTTEEKMINNLARYRWTLATATDNTKQPLTPLMDIKDQVTLNFSQSQGQNTINYSVGCNTMSAVYQLQGGALMTENSMSTKMSCGDLNAAENRLNELMQGDSQLSLADDSNDGTSNKNSPMLTQVTSDSITLVWKGKLTAQAKYNTKGETLFWAVNADSKPCADNSAQTCLQVKPVTYDAQGVKTSEGELTDFAGNIDGYVHDGKHDEVLRLQRYKLDAEEAAGEEYAYVLDTVIESAVAK